MCDPFLTCLLHASAYLQKHANVEWLPEVLGRQTYGCHADSSQLLNYTGAVSSHAIIMYIPSFTQLC